MDQLMAVVLAAGKGTRMRSELPKVLVPVAGRPMVRYVLDALSAAGVGRVVVVVGYQADLVRRELADQHQVEFALQSEQLGTGHAVMQCRPQLSTHRGGVLVVTGDSPMLQPASIGRLQAAFDREHPAAIVGTARRDDPHGLGRIVRDADGQFVAIVEEKDATPEQRGITEVNMSTYVFDSVQLLRALDRLTNRNAQGEYYVTDVPGLLRAEGQKVLALDALEPCESLSINSPDDIPAVEAELQRRVPR